MKIKTKTISTGLDPLSATQQDALKSERAALMEVARAAIMMSNIISAYEERLMESGDESWSPEYERQMELSRKAIDALPAGTKAELEKR